MTLKSRDGPWILVAVVGQSPEKASGSNGRSVAGGRAVRLDGYRRQPINTIEVLGLGHDRIVLLVVPPNTDPTHAPATMMAAAEPNNASTVDNLLVVNVDERRRRTTVAVAQERWESEGGTLLTSRLG